MEKKFELKMETDFTILGLETGHEYKIISPNKQGETGVYGITNSGIYVGGKLYSPTKTIGTYSDDSVYDSVIHDWYVPYRECYHEFDYWIYEARVGWYCKQSLFIDMGSATNLGKVSGIHLNDPEMKKYLGVLGQIVRIKKSQTAKPIWAYVIKGCAENEDELSWHIHWDDEPEIRKMSDSEIEDSINWEIQIKGWANLRRY